MRPSSAKLLFCSYNCTYAALQANLRAACKLSGSLTIGRLENALKGFSFHRTDSSPLSSLFQRLRELEPQLQFSCSQICDGAGRAFGEGRQPSRTVLAAPDLAQI